MNDDLLQLFLVESRDLIARAQDSLANIESGASSKAAIDELFRAIHTLKGSVAIFDWSDFERMLHAAEDLLGAFRHTPGAADRAACDALEACVDASEKLLGLIETRGSMPDDAATMLAPAVRALSAARGDATPADEHREPAAALDDTLVQALFDMAREDGAEIASPCFLVSYVPHADAYFAGEDPLAIARRTPGLVAIKVTPREPWPDLGAYDPFACNLQFHILASAPRDAIAAAFTFSSDQISIAKIEVDEKNASPADASPKSERRFLRVDPARVDLLAHALDEVIVHTNSLSELAFEAGRGASGGELADMIRDRQAAIGRLTARMHSALTVMRLVPLAPALRRLPRIARDLAAQMGKDIEVALDIEEIEADKSIVDGLSEPLLHVLRNAVDHGIEGAAQRRQSSKPEAGRIVLSARRAGEHVLIAIADDGRGLDAARIRAVARERALVPAAALDSMPEEEVLDLVFRPGFSTAATVSSVSGRGVGMDAVRSAIEAMGGRVDIESTFGRGAKVTLRLPLRLVLTPLVLVECSGEAYGVAIDDVVEIVTIRARDVTPIRHGKAFLWRGRPIPLVEIAELLHGARVESETVMTIVVVLSGNERVGVRVDKVVDRIEAVVRPMTGLLAGIRGFSGTTLLSNGLVLIVLDVSELLE